MRRVMLKVAINIRVPWYWAKNVSTEASCNRDGEAHLHDGEGVEGEVGDGEDEGGGEEELGEVVEESPEKRKFGLKV